MHHSDYEMACSPKLSTRHIGQHAIEEPQRSTNRLFQHCPFLRLVWFTYRIYHKACHPAKDGVFPLVYNYPASYCIAKPKGLDAIGTHHVMLTNTPTYGIYMFPRRVIGNHTCSITMPIKKLSLSGLCPIALKVVGSLACTA